jgi:glucans biosynthesis protein
MKALALGIVCLLVAPPVLSFGFEDVARRARSLADAPYKSAAAPLPKELQGLTYESYQDIRFRPERSLWRGTPLPFEVAFFHQGWHFRRPVRINEVTAEGVREIAFDPADFDYGRNKVDPAKLRGLGFAGFRLHFPVNTPKYKDEIIAFLGASYFRAIGKGQRYGLSARGLAVDTALASGEEFPAFVEFWIERPSAKAAEVAILALLDSPRATGAYRFVVRPGTETALEVKARLFLRDKVGKLGLAPLTSMFFTGENQRGSPEDYRPEVHDSDGLSVQLASGEWLWRPLHNPKRLLVTSFATANPAGFGLMQRDRDFSHYNDLDARYELRPSAWVEPKGPWGPGRVELVQIPAPDETNDNIVAFWVPERAPAPREPLDIEYRVRWQKDGETRPPQSWVAQTRRGQGYTRSPDGSVGLAVDFEGPALKRLAADARVEAQVSVIANGKVIAQETRRNEVTGGWRLTLRLRREDEAKPLELRAYLKNGNDTLSETWSYILPPS